MKSLLVSVPTMALLMSGCAALGLFTPASNLKPTYDATTVSPVITQVHRTGSVAPPYNHTDTLTIDGSGAWRADRVFGYTTATPSTYLLATGSLSTSQVQALVNKAFGSPRFVDLADAIDDHSIGGGTQTITLAVQNGSKSVSVTGAEPAAFSAFDAAISAATVDMGSVGPTMAGQQAVRL